MAEAETCDAEDRRALCAMRTLRAYLHTHHVPRTRGAAAMGTGIALLRELDPSFPRLSLVRLRGCRDCANHVCTTLRCTRHVGWQLGTSIRRHTQTPPRAQPSHELLSSLKSRRLHQDASRPGKRDHPACRHAAWPSEGLAGASYAGMQVATTSKLRALPTCPQPWTCIARLPRHQAKTATRGLRVSPAPRRGAVPKAYFLTCLGCRCTACLDGWSERLNGLNRLTARVEERTMGQ